MATQEILEYVKGHPSAKVKIAFTDIDGILRGKYLSLEKFLSIVENGMGFCDVLFGWDSGDVAYDNVQYTGWHTGYPDAPATIDMSTFRKIPWEDGLPFFLGDMAEKDGHPNHVCPRQLLKRISLNAEAQGYTPFF